MSAPARGPNQGRIVAVRRWANVMCSPSALGSFWGKCLSTLKRVSQLAITPRNEGGTSFFNHARNVYINGGMTVNINTGLSGIILIDAGAKEHQVPMELALSYETFTKTLDLLLSGPAMEAQVQRRFMEAGMFDLCIDYGTLVVPIAAERDWSMVQPGNKVVMRIVIHQPNEDMHYQCPRCKAWNQPHEGIQNTSIDCRGCYGRFQLSETNVEVQREGSERFGQQSSQGDDMKMLRNFHLKRQTTAPVVDIQTSPMPGMESDFGVSPEETPYHDFLNTPLFGDDDILTTSPMMTDAPLFPPYIESDGAEGQAMPKTQNLEGRYNLPPFSSLFGTFTDAHSFPTPAAPVAPVPSLKIPAAPRRTSRAISIYKGVIPDSFDEGTPTQTHNYTTSCTTSEEGIPATFGRKRTRSIAFGAEEDQLLDNEPLINSTDKDLIKPKRRQDTVTIRRSRKRKLV